MARDTRDVKARIEDEYETDATVEAANDHAGLMTIAFCADTKTSDGDTLA